MSALCPYQNLFYTIISNLPAPDVTEKSYTFHEASQECKKVGLMLQSEFGIGRGDVVGFFLPSSPEYLTCLTGVIGIGAAATTINPAYTTQELTHQVRSLLQIKEYVCFSLS